MTDKLISVCRVFLIRMLLIIMFLIFFICMFLVFMFRLYLSLGLMFQHYVNESLRDNGYI